MRNTPYVRAALAQAVLERTPPVIRETLLDEPSFRDEYGLSVDATMSFGDTGVSVQRSELLSAIRSFLSGKTEAKVNDAEGQEWIIENFDEGVDSFRHALVRLDQRQVLPDFNTLSPDELIRLRSFERAISDVNLPVSDQTRWREILKERSLDDDELNTYQSEFRDTPVDLARSISDQLVTGNSSVSILVPHSRRYFERLVGAYDDSESIQDYATSLGSDFFRDLSRWHAYKGFLHSLLLSSHSSLTAEISAQNLNNEDLLRAFELLVKRGDRVSQLGAVEVGFRILPLHPELEATLVLLIKEIRDDDVDGKASGFKLLSASFVLVDGELSRTRLFSDLPPFYRRLAALSQAALIQRQIINARADLDSFCEWAVSYGGEFFYMQSLADMRLEPRWNPDLAAASQMKADFWGRIMIAASTYQQNIKEGELADLVLAKSPATLHSFGNLFNSYLPGPLEGAEDSQNVLPSEMAEAIESQLSAEEVEPKSFVALVNSALIFRVGSDQAELAAKALKLASHRLANVENESQLRVILHGLATVAAAARNHALADELRILFRRYWRGDHYALSIEEAMRICFMAASSRTDLHAWREFSGEWMTELAFGELTKEDGKILHSHLECICHAVPELWVSCGRADAALMAFNGR